MEELSGELLRDQLVAFCRAHPSVTATDGTAVDVRAACGMPASWDLWADPRSRGIVLWQGLLHAAPSGVSLYRTPFDPAQPLVTPRDLDTGSPATGRALADTAENMTRLGVPLDVPLGAAQRYQGIAGPGCGGEIGCFDVAQPVLPLRAGGTYGDVPAGSSFIMAVSLTSAGSHASTLLTYSESANAASPHHTDQTPAVLREALGPGALHRIGDPLRPVLP